MSGQRIRIRLRAFDHRMLDQSAIEIVETTKRTGARVAGPGPPPTPTWRCPVSTESWRPGPTYSLRQRPTLGGSSA